MEIDFREAIELMKAGQEEGFNKLYSATYNKVYFRARQCTKSELDAQDVTQITFIEAYKNINKLEAPEATLSWLYTIVYNQSCKLYRNEREKREFLLSEETEGVFDTVESTDIETMPELSADQKATAEIIRAIIEELPELQRMTVLAFYFDNFKIEQIAKTMDCSEGTVKSRLNYARKYIKDRVESEEKKGGYKLHAFALPTLLFAIKMLSEKTTLTVYAAENIYAGSCSALGLKASTLALAGAGTSAAGSVASAGTTASATVAKTAAAAGSKVGTAKALMIAGAVAVGGAGIGGAVYVHNQAEPVAIVEEITLEDGEGVTEDGLFEYYAKGDIVTLTAYISDETDVVIPLEVAGRTKIKLGAKLFQDTKVKSVDITDNVTELCSEPFNEVFRNAHDLESVIITGNLSMIPADTFHECTNLASVTLKDGIEQIDDNAFFYCIKLTNLEVPDSVKYIGKNILSCTNTMEITVSQDCVVNEINTTGFPNSVDLIIHRKGQDESVEVTKTLQDDLSEEMYLVKLVDVGGGMLEESSNPRDRIYPEKISDNEYHFSPELMDKIFDYGEYVGFQGIMPEGIDYESFMYGDTIGDFHMVEGVQELAEGINGSIAFHLDTNHDVVVILK